MSGGEAIGLVVVPFVVAIVARVELAILRERRRIPYVPRHARPVSS